MIILGISTSSPRGTVAIVRDAEVVARIAYDGGTSHAERLFAAIDQVMEHAAVTRADLTALACDVGPGSFTGVRVGVASAKGIVIGLGLPVIGIGSLEAMAFAATATAAGREVLAIVDARKGEVFAALYDDVLSATWGPVHVARDASATLVELATAHRALAVGEIVAALDGFSPPPRSEALDLPDAASMALLAARRLASPSSGQAAECFDAADLEAIYVRAPDAKPLSEQR